MSASDLDEAGIFNTARQIEDTAARQLYIRQACGEDDKSRRRIEALLRVHEEKRGILQSPTEELHAILDASGSVPPNTPIVADNLLEKLGLNVSTSDIALAPAQAPDEIGRLGGYRILKKLGAGGMGVVYQAEDEQLQRPIALKVIKADLAQNFSHRERFLREARAVAKLRSDHVVHVYQVGEERQIVFLAMEFLEGLSLADWLKEGNKPTAAQAARIGREIALGLADAHACGLIHRDIKSGNIWLDSRHQDRVKLLDFGLARGDSEEAQLTQTGAIVGTPEFMSPEQARGDKIDLRCDLFSLGVVLYRLTTGAMPFRGASTMAILTSLAVDTPPPPRQINSAIPPRLSTLIERLLSKDREKRPATARAVADELALLERETTVPAESDITPVIGVTKVLVPAVVSPRSRSRRRRLLRASTLVLLVLALSILVYVMAWKFKVREDSVPPSTRAEIVGQEEPLAPPGDWGDLDTLEAAKIPEEERIEGLPCETVAVLGSHRGWQRNTKGECGCFLAYSPDGRRIVTVLGGLCGVHVWDAESLRQLGRIPLPHSYLTGLALSPEGKSLALAMDEDEGRVHFWDVSGDKPAELLPALENKDTIHGLSYSPDGKTLAFLVGDKSLVRLWDMTAAPPRVLTELPQADKDAPPTFSPDGKRLVYGDGKTGLLLWDVSVTPPQKVYVFPKDGGFFRTAFSADGKTLAAADRDNAVWLLDWDGVELKKRSSYPSSKWEGHPLSALMFAPQGKKLALSPVDRCPRILDWSDPQLREMEFDGYETVPFNVVAFSPDGRTLAACSCAYGGGNLRLWDVTGSKPRDRSGIPGHVNSVQSLAFSRDGKLLVSGGDTTVHLWRPRGGRFEQFDVVEHPGAIQKLALAADGKTLAVIGKDTLRLWDLSGPKPQERMTASGDIRAIALSPDGQKLAWGERTDVHLDDLSQRKPVEKTVLPGHQTRVDALAFSPDGQTLASGGRDNDVRLWDLTPKKPRIRTIIPLPDTHEPDEQVEDLAFMPEGKSLLVQRRWIGQVWDLAMPNPQMKWEFTCTGRELCMTPAQDGQSIFAVGNRMSREMLQRWFSPSDMRPWWVPGDHPCMALAADGRHLAIGNANGTIYVLRMPLLTTAYPPLVDAWIKETAAMTLRDQIEAVAEELKRRNPEFDGDLKPRIEKSELVELDFSLKRIFDLSPLQVLRPRKLNLGETYSISNLSPLRGLPLELLYLGQNTIADFSPLKDLPLRDLRFYDSFNAEHLAPLRSIKTLQTINDKPAAEFWKQVDAAKKADQ